MKSSQDRYAARGVSAQKDDVHKAIQGLSKGLYPGAFAKILPDLMGGDESRCMIMHADTAGTKTSLAYLYWRETGDLDVWKGIAQDAIVMNTDDMLCVGCTGPIVLSSTIGRNAHLISGDVIGAVIQGAEEVMDMLRLQGINIQSAGGETADVGDIVRTIDVGYTTCATMDRSAVIDMNLVPELAIVGLASYGQSTYESSYNSGIGSNGLTSARHDMLSSYYASAYPESRAPQTQDQVVYTGPYRLQDHFDIDGTSYEIGRLLLSPTRTYAPVLRSLIDSLPKGSIHGIVHATGGGQTKVLKFAPDVSVIKDGLPTPPPLFHEIKRISNATWHEMYQVFNMGVRMEIYVPPSEVASVIDIASRYHIEAWQIGHTIKRQDTHMTLYAADGSTVTY